MTSIDSSEASTIARSGDTLHVEGVSLTDIAAAVDTPAYVYSGALIRQQYAKLSNALTGVPHRLHYAMKANSNRAVLQLLKGLGAGIDIVSGGELFRALAAGYSGADVVFSGVGKTVAELEYALASGVKLINVESQAELVALNEVAMQLGSIAPVALRVNPEVTVNAAHAYISTGEKGHKFGIPHEEVPHLLEFATGLSNIRLAGLGMHLGSQINNASPLRDAMPRLFFALAEARRLGHEPQFLDLGGGLSVPYAAHETDADVDDYATLLRTSMQSAGGDLELLLEPGRFLVAESGVLIVKVLYLKHAAGKHFVVTDGGMNDLIRPALYQAWHNIEAVVDTGGELVADVVGPICESSDFFALQRRLSRVVAGDLLAVRTTGAYGYAMASTYNSRPRPAEVLVDGSRFAVISERECYEDLMRLETDHLQWRSC